MAVEFGSSRCLPLFAGSSRRAVGSNSGRGVEPPLYPQLRSRHQGLALMHIVQAATPPARRGGQIEMSRVTVAP